MNHTYQIKFHPPKGTVFLENEINRYKALGFNIEDVVDTPFYEVTFPNGWGFGGYEIFYGTPIHDEQNRLRGWISFSTQHMGLYTRYNIKSITKSKNHRYIVIFDRSHSKILYQIGEYNNVEDEYKLLGKAHNYLNTNYPDWEKFDAYWD